MKVVSFTGSTSVGQTINEACAPSFKHVHLEMGGKNPIIVMDDANLELAVDGAIWGAFGTSGQRCTASSRLLVHKKVVRKFTAMLAERADALKVGSGLDERNEMGPVHQREPARHGPRLHLDRQGRGREGASPAAASRGQGRTTKGWFVAPTVFADCDRRMRVAREEIFGARDVHRADRVARGGDRRRERQRVRPLVGHLHAGREQGLRRDARPRGRASSTSISRRSAPRRTCRSAARRRPETGTARRASPRWTSSASGSRSTSTTPGTIQKAQIDVPAGEASAKKKR